MPDDTPASPGERIDPADTKDSRTGISPRQAARALRTWLDDATMGDMLNDPVAMGRSYGNCEGSDGAPHRWEKDFETLCRWHARKRYAAEDDAKAAAKLAQAVRAMLNWTGTVTGSTDAYMPIGSKVSKIGSVDAVRDALAAYDAAHAGGEDKP